MKRKFTEKALKLERECCEEARKKGEKGDAKMDGAAATRKRVAEETKEEESAMRKKAKKTKKQGSEDGEDAGSGWARNRMDIGELLVNQE